MYEYSIYLYVLMYYIRILVRVWLDLYKDSCSRIFQKHLLNDYSTSSWIHNKNGGELLNFPCTAAAKRGRSPVGGKEGDVLTIGQPSTRDCSCYDCGMFIICSPYDMDNLMDIYIYIWTMFSPDVHHISFSASMLIFSFEVTCLCVVLEPEISIR